MEARVGALGDLCVWSEWTCLRIIQPLPDIFKDGKMELQSQLCRVHGQQHVDQRGEPSAKSDSPDIFMRGHTIVV
jgi:hypothetical protein